MRLFRRYLIAGLFVWLPLWVTLLGIRFVIDVLDSTLSLLPRAYRPDELFGMHIPCLGLILFLTGILVTNFIGNWLIQAWESFLARIPLVRTIYAGVKKILETLFSPSGQSF